MENNNPVGYKVQRGIPCCANCKFGGYLGIMSQVERICICEIMGECPNGDYASLAVEPLGVCDAWKCEA